LIAAACFRSTYNIYRWYQLRKHKKTKALGLSEREIITDEIENLQSALPLLKTDHRLGYHEEAKFQMFDEKTLKRKLEHLKSLDLKTRNQ